MISVYRISCTWAVTVCICERPLHTDLVFIIVTEKKKSLMLMESTRFEVSDVFMQKGDYTQIIRVSSYTHFLSKCARLRTVRSGVYVCVCVWGGLRGYPSSAKRIKVICSVYHPSSESFVGGGHGYHVPGGSSSLWIQITANQSSSSVSGLALANKKGRDDVESQNPKWHCDLTVSFISVAPPPRHRPPTLPLPSVPSTVFHPPALPFHITHMGELAQGLSAFM